MIQPAAAAAFAAAVWRHYREQGRRFDWRADTAPYRIFVSELMLQQTQCARVAQKFPGFVARFPDFGALAQAALADVLAEWQGLGYNRRAKFMHQAARVVAERFDGRLPADRAALEALPGIGPNTAGAMLAYAFNLPAVFVETNIRTVYIHHFFPEGTVDDKRIAALVGATLDRERPREWYWALMDYGAQLKKTVGNLTRRSSHYARQSRFEGSLRQVRGRVVALLGQSGGHLDRAALAEALPEAAADGRLDQALSGLCAEGMLAARPAPGGTEYGLPR